MTKPMWTMWLTGQKGHFFHILKVTNILKYYSVITNLLVKEVIEITVLGIIKYKVIFADCALS